MDELRSCATGWIHYFGISHSYEGVRQLDECVQRRGRLYYWKQCKRLRALRGHLVPLRILPEEVKMATRSRKGYWRMSANSIVQRALTNRWLYDQGVSDMRQLWIVLEYGANARV